MTQKRFIQASYYPLVHQPIASNIEFHRLAYQLMQEAGLDHEEDTAAMVAEYGAIAGEAARNVAFKRAFDSTPSLRKNDEKCRRCYLHIIGVLSAQNLGVNALDDNRWLWLKESVLKPFPRKMLRQARPLRMIGFRNLVTALHDNWMDLVDKCDLTPDIEGLEAGIQALEEASGMQIDERIEKFGSHANHCRCTLNDLYRRIISHVCAWANNPTEGTPRAPFYAQMRLLLNKCNSLMVTAE